MNRLRIAFFVVWLMLMAAAFTAMPVRAEVPPTPTTHEITVGLVVYSCGSQEPDSECYVAINEGRMSKVDYATVQWTIMDFTRRYDQVIVHRLWG